MHFESLHYFAFRLPFFLTSRIIDAAHSIFLLQTELAISSAFYALLTQQNIWSPNRLAVNISAVGQSTVTVTSKLNTLNSELLLATQKGKSAKGNFSTKKSQPLSTTLREDYAEHCSPSGGLTPFPVIEAPDGAFSCPILLRHSDTDEYQHTNNTVYVRLAIDCAMMAFQRGGYFKNFVCNIQTRQGRSIKSSFLQDSQLGDTLVASAREDATDENRLLFQFRKE